MNYTVATYLLYLLISVPLAVAVGKTLHANGRIFLVDIFAQNEPLADSVNHLLLVGFYLINGGFITNTLKTGETIQNVQGLVEVLSGKIGVVLLVLGAMHFFNLHVFSRLRRA
ncbi:MAG: hypothetical protein RLZZ142_2480, partial [Verrucomicrobiota bacterium]